MCVAGDSLDAAICEYALAQLAAGDAAIGLQLWQAWLDLPEAQVAAAYEVLSPEEQARAGQFHFAVDHNRFVVRRAMLRTVLGRIIGCPAARVELQAAALGKPFLAANPAQVDLQFSHSHSGGLVLVAVARGGQIGVDVEKMRPIDDLAALIDSFLTPAEKQRQNAG